MTTPLMTRDSPPARLPAARALLVRQGAARFGPRADAADRLAAVADLAPLEALAAGVLAAADWDGLLGNAAGPA